MDIQFSNEIVGFECIKCQEMYPIQDMFEGCLTCKAKGTPSSVKPIYKSPFNGLNWLPFEKSLSLGEGNTPLIKMATDFGSFYIKMKH